MSRKVGIFLLLFYFSFHENMYKQKKGPVGR